jgi:hypothetical protein
MWIVIVRATNKCDWAAHGPFEYQDACDYDHSLAGTGLEHHIVKLIKPWGVLQKEKTK